MTQLSPIWTKKRIPQEELDAYLNGNPTNTTGSQHFLYQPNYDDCIAANGNTSPDWKTQNARNKKFKQSAVALKKSSSNSMDLNSKIHISERLPMGPDIRYREYKSYEPYRPNPDFSADPFKKITSGKGNTNGFLSGTYREYGNNRKRPVVAKQRISSKPQKTKPVANKQIQAPKPEKTKSKTDKKIPEKEVAKPERKAKSVSLNLQKTSIPEKKPLFTETVDDDYDEFVSNHYLSIPKAARMTAAARAWRRMYEVR